MAFLKKTIKKRTNTCVFVLRFIPIMASPGGELLLVILDLDQHLG